MLTANHKLLIEVLGGSRSYGLVTETSDTDYRGVFINTDIAHLLGLKKDEVLVSQATEDKVFTEFRHALKLLRQANTQMIELLFINNFINVSDEWEVVRRYRNCLIESSTLYKALKGYMQSELRLANGERTGRLGSKRKDSIDKFGFSPKNFTQLLRLAWAGKYYFDYNVFPVNVQEYDYDFRNFLLNIKVNPHEYTKEQLNNYVKEAEQQLEVSFSRRSIDNHFNEEIANNLCHYVYSPFIKNLCPPKI